MTFQSSLDMPNGMLELSFSTHFLHGHVLGKSMVQWLFLLDQFRQEYWKLDLKRKILFIGSIFKNVMGSLLKQ